MHPQAPVNVTTGMPKGEWKSFLVIWKPILVAICGGCLFKLLEHYAHPYLLVAYAVAYSIVFFTVIVRMRNIRHRFALRIDGHPVRIDIDAHGTGKVWLAWESAHGSGRSFIGKARRSWIDHELVLGGKCYNLRVFVTKNSRSSPYMPFKLSNRDRGFEMVVLENTYCLA